MILGIDFGTCFSSVTAIDESGNPLDVMFADDNTGTGMPSVLAIENGKIFSGFACERNNSILLGKKVRYLKKQIRSSKDGDPLVLPPDESKAFPGYKDYTRSMLLGFYLQDLIEKAVIWIKEQGSVEDDDRIEGITITVPVGLGYRKTMRTSYVDTLIAQLKVAVKSDNVRKLLPGQVFDEQGKPKMQVTTLAEPVSAALAYLEKSNKCRKLLRGKPKGKILVIDIGGGTADFTAIGYEVLEDKKRYEVLAEEGDLSLGGNDWDDALFSLINKKLFQGKLSAEDKDYWKRMRAVNEVKHILSQNDTAIYTDPVTQGTVEISRKEFEECSRPLVKRLQDLTKAVVEKQGVGGIDQIDKILLVGGASKMPMVRSGILQLYPQKNDDIFDTYLPSKAIAIGAALYCKAVEKSEVIVHLKAQATYGTGHLEKGASIVDNHIFKGQAFGEEGVLSKTTGAYYPVKDAQKTVTWKIYESDSTEETAPLSKEYHFNGMEYTIDVPERYWQNNRSREYKHWAVIKLYESGKLDVAFYEMSSDGTSEKQISKKRIKEKIVQVDF